MALDMGQIELAGKSESYEICFVPDNDYRAFLRHKVEGLEERVAGGNFVLTDGTIVGQHQGYPFIHRPAQGFGHRIGSSHVCNQY